MKEHHSEEKWDSLGLFVKYGMMTDDKFLEKANKFHLFQAADGSKFYTLEEYRLAAETLQKNKDGKLVILYTHRSCTTGCLYQSCGSERLYRCETGYPDRCQLYQPDGA